jgi:hypothetical protein
VVVVGGERRPGVDDDGKERLREVDGSAAAERAAGEGERNRRRRDALGGLDTARDEEQRSADEELQVLSLSLDFIFSRSLG